MNNDIQKKAEEAAAMREVLNRFTPFLHKYFMQFGLEHGEHAELCRRINDAKSEYLSQTGNHTAGYLAAYSTPSEVLREVVEVLRKAGGIIHAQADRALQLRGHSQRYAREAADKHPAYLRCMEVLTKAEKHLKQ